MNNQRRRTYWKLHLLLGQARAAISMRLIIVLICLLVLPPTARVEAVVPPASVSAPTNPGDEYWAAGFDLMGMGGDVTALAFGPDGTLYAGGQFIYAGGVTVNYIARWDGVQWTPLGSGMDGNISALWVSPAGSLYAGGFFTMAGGVAANNIARWDGSQWHALGSGTDFRVLAITSGPDDSLYAGGGFTSAGGVIVNRIARWDGSQWHALGSGTNRPIYALTFGLDGFLYAGGEFTTIGGVGAQYIARWDGSQWSPLGSGMAGGASGTVFDLSIGTDGSLYAGGSFIVAGGILTNLIARWDGSEWHALGSGLGGGGGEQPHVFALASGLDGSLYAAGWFTTAGGVTANYIARWDGSQWHALGSGVNNTVWTLATGPDGSLYAGGGFSTAGGKQSFGIGRWNGEAVRRCDFNDNGAVDVGDIMIVAALWNQPAGPPYDLDGDGVITVVDIQRVARWWDWSVP